MIKALLFDLDGVLVDLCGVHYESFNKALAALGYPIIESQDHDGNFNGLPTNKKIDILIGRGADIPESHRRRLWELKQKYTWGEIAKLKPRPKLIKLLSGLYGQEYLLGVVTNSVRQTVTMVLNRLDIAQFFNVIISNEDVTSPKPSPEPYQLACKALRIDPSESLIFEDSEVGLKAAKASGGHVHAVIGPQDLKWRNVWMAIVDANGNYIPERLTR